MQVIIWSIKDPSVNEDVQMKLDRQIHLSSGEFIILDIEEDQEKIGQERS